MSLLGSTNRIVVVCFITCKHFFDKVDLLPKNINMLDGRAKNLKQECHRFDQIIKQAGGIDWQLLGIGSNGHIG